jgi:hypothetical protein
MSNEFITTDAAYDTLDLLRRSCESLTSIRRLMRRVRRDGKTVDAEKARKALDECIIDLIESCAHLSQGDDADRIELSKDLAARILEEDIRP